MAIKTIFLGSNWESLETLKVLHKDKRFEIVAIITAPDKPVGRKQILTSTPVNTFAKENNIPVHITNSDPVKYQEATSKYLPELAVCIAFGEKIPITFLEYPEFKCINVHFSLLPKYRGSVPIQMAILNGETETGISFMQMVDRWDAGPVLSTIKENIQPDDTNLTLRKRLVEISTEKLPEILIKWVNGEIIPIQQDETEANYCFMKDISKEKAEIKWREMDAEYIDRMVRAMIPWPTAWCMFKGKRMKVLEAKISDQNYSDDLEYKVIDKKLIFKTINGFIEVVKLQIEGKSEVQASSFVNSLNK